MINLKKKQMTFKGHNIRIITPLDPSMGPHYEEPIRVKEEAGVALAPVHQIQKD